MGNIFHDFYDTIVKNEKEMLINSSGSTSKDKCERIRAGQSYLYKKQGMESEVIEIRFDKNISGSALTSALALTKKRYPYFKTKLIEKDGDFYIVQNRGTLSPRRTRKLFKLGHISVGNHLIDVTYHRNTICFISSCSLRRTWYYAFCGNPYILLL